MNWFRIFFEFCLPIGIAGNFSEIEFGLIRSICDFFNVKFIVFIEDESNYFEMSKAVKMSSKGGIPSIAVDSNRLREELVKMENRFFQERRTVFATKSKIRLGSYLKLIRNPKWVVWALFVEPSDILSVGREISVQGRILKIKWEMDRLVVNELLRSEEIGRIVEREFGQFSDKSKAQFVARGWDFYSHKLNMSNLVIKVGISTEICRSRKDGVLLEVIFCSHSQILELMVEKLNIRKEYIRYPETQYSFVYPNGSYSGYFKMVLDREVNMSVAGFVVTGKRLNDLDFIWPTFALDTMMYLKKEDIVNASLTKSPFSNAVWIVISVLILSSGTFLFVTKYSNRKPETIRRIKWRLMSESILKIVQLICNQGSSEDPSHSSSRIIHCTSLFGGMLLYYYYSAVVLSFLTVESVSLPFTDIEGFIENKKYKIIAPAGGFVSYFVEFELTQLRRKTGGYMVPSDKLPPSIDECVIELCDKKLLTLLELEGSLLNIKESDCELSEIPSPVFTQFFGFALVKGFPYTEYFQLVLWRLKEIGLLVRMQQNLTRYNDLKELHKDSDYKTVAIEQIMNVLIILTFGFISSVWIFVLELIHFRKRRKMSLKREWEANVKRVSFFIGNENFVRSRIKPYRFQGKILND